jgi:hypothetical protein
MAFMYSRPPIRYARSISCSLESLSRLVGNDRSLYWIQCISSLNVSGFSRICASDFVDFIVCEKSASPVIVVMRSEWMLHAVNSEAIVSSVLLRASTGRMDHIGG